MHEIQPSVVAIIYSPLDTMLCSQCDLFVAGAIKTTLLIKITLQITGKHNSVPCTTLALRPVLTEITQQDVEENITQLVTLARIALENGDLEKAQSILEMGISVGEEYRAYIIMPYMYDLLSSILFSTGNLKKAEEVLVRAIEQMVQLGSPENDTQIIDFKLRLARIYSFNDKHKLAEMGFRNCVALQEAKILNGDTSTRTGTLYVNVLFWYAMHKIKTKEYKGAKRLIDNAYTYSLKIRGLTPYQEMVILYTMGDLNIQLEEYDMALQNIRSAVLMGKGIGSLNLPRYYMKLGMIYLKFDLKRTAEKMVDRSL
ncbi:hypothetical protein NQ317_012355 [Molorchus minor]|uniref:MalT-like TPR region domain-containing protein n=1 Tax=Molorchus minor TaxID=1323400 RepID=A0ABQ9J0Y1_9CUCU|nr:hypothetical protein NQ317_012355 [Molorchus minor]